MMINTSKFSKGLITMLVYNILTIFIVVCETLPDTNNVMSSIQLGIQETVNANTSEPKWNFSESNFNDYIEIKFKSSDVTNNTPHHPNFIFITYAPLIFHYLRGLFNIQSYHYLESFCTSPFREMPNPGKSKSIFYPTPDNKFIIKTVQETESVCLQKLLSTYSIYMKNNPGSLLPKFSGFYCYKDNSTDIKLVSMNNLLPSNIVVHQKYDLKGSIFNRIASKFEIQKPSPTLKDLNFNDDHPDGIFMKSDIRSALIKIIKSDCELLESFNIMDYSLLMGIHNIDLAVKTYRDTSSLAAAARWDRLMADSTGMKSIRADTAIPAKSSSGDRLLLFVGIIDVLQTYRLKKKVENKLKTIRIKVTPGLTTGVDTISVQPPNAYASRFMTYMAESVFKPLLSPQELEPSKQPKRRRIVDQTEVSY